MFSEIASYSDQSFVKDWSEEMHMEVYYKSKEMFCE